MRWILGALGAVMVGYGVVLAIDTKPVFEAAFWLAGGTVVHDAVLAPVIGLTGWLLARFASPPWRAPVAVGAAVTGVLALLTLPELVRPYPAPVNPGLHDRDYLLALALTVAVVWAVVLTTGVIRSRQPKQSA